jgi:hypothetical protein
MRFFNVGATTVGNAWVRYFRVFFIPHDFMGQVVYLLPYNDENKRDTGLICAEFKNWIQAQCS